MTVLLQSQIGNSQSAGFTLAQESIGIVLDLASAGATHLATAERGQADGLVA